MAKRPWFPLYPADYQLDTAGLSFEEHGVYLCLLQWAWQRPDTALPDDPKWFLARMPQGSKMPTYRRQIVPILERFWTLENSQWTNNRLTKEAQRADIVATKAAHAAHTRWSDPKENKDLADADAMPRARVSQSQSQSHRETRMRATPLPEDWKPTAEGLAHGHKLLGVDKTQREIRSFRDHAKATGRTMKDWDAAWRMWVSKALQFAAQSRGGPVAANPTGGPARLSTAI